MNRSIFQAAVFATLVAGGFLPAARAQYLDQIGLTLLRATATNLNGTGMKVGQVEAGYESATNWQVNPGVVGQATNFFTYFYGTSPYLMISSASTFPNSLGGPSGHANNVAGVYFGMNNGVATNLAHMDVYEANSFVNYYVDKNHAITERIVNQSFTFGTNDASISQIYDDYAAQRGVLFVSGAGLPNLPVYSPATCYNGIGVGVFNYATPPYGPTVDGRSKPDITAFGYPDTVTSYSTPQVSGAAVLLLQAGARGDGGASSNAATDIRTLKALLLNGAVKPADWTNSPSAPLHYRYGAGVLNVFNSYEQLAGGKHSYVVSNLVSAGSAHPPTGATGTIPVLSGWDFGTNTSSSSPARDAIYHYYFNVTNDLPEANFTATATLVWNKQQSKTAINNLGLFLYNCSNSNLVMCSTSLVDNVEHIFVPQLPQGRYDLQVWKAGISGMVSTAEPYALSYAFTMVALNVTFDGTNAMLTWPAYPAGFQVQSTADLALPVWSTNGLPASVFTNGVNSLTLQTTNTQQFFRLAQPNF